MKYLFLMLLLVSCSRNEPKYAGQDCVLVSDPFYSNFQRNGIVFEIESYNKNDSFGEVEYLGCFKPFLAGPGCKHFKESEITQTVMCPE